MKPKLSGFTLIELLVVIAIIAILAAILFPVFAQAREKAREISCLSNNKQLATAVLIYCQDYDENFPGWPDPRANPLFRRYGWQMIVKVMDPYTTNRRLWSCPSANPLIDENNGKLWGPKNDKFACSLAYSEYLYNTNHGRGARPAQPPYYGVWNNQAALASTRAGVAQICIMADSSFPGIFNDWSNYDGYRIVGEPNPASFGLLRIKYANGGIRGTKVNPWYPNGPRHIGNSANCIFADGHAKTITGGSIRGAYNPDPKSTDAETGGFPEWPVVNPNNVPPGG